MGENLAWKYLDLFLGVSNTFVQDFRVFLPNLEVEYHACAHSHMVDALIKETTT